MTIPTTVASRIAFEMNPMIMAVVVDPYGDGSEWSFIVPVQLSSLVPFTFLLCVQHNSRAYLSAVMGP
jgi:hypothetical protein